MAIRPELAKIKNAYKLHFSNHDQELKDQLDNKMREIYKTTWHTNPEDAHKQIQKMHFDTCLKLEKPVLIPVGTKIVCKGSGTATTYTTVDCHVIGLTGMKPGNKFCELLIDVPTVYSWKNSNPTWEITIDPNFICDTNILSEICEQL